MHTRIRQVATVDPDSGGPRAGVGADSTLRRYRPRAGSPRPRKRGRRVGRGRAPTRRPCCVRPAPALRLGGLAPAVAAPGRGAAGGGTPAWPFVTLAAVLVILFGVGHPRGATSSSPTSRRDGRSTRDPAGPAEPPTKLTIKVIDPEDGTGDRPSPDLLGAPAGVTRTSTTSSVEGHPPTMSATRPHPVHGENSIVRRSRRLPDRCITVRRSIPTAARAPEEDVWMG